MAEAQRLSVTFKPDAVGTVKATIGSVKAIDPSGVERELIAGDKVYPHETIVTGPGGLIIVELANGSTVDVAASSKWVLDEEVLGLAAAPAPAEAMTVEQIQERIARGEDPTAITEASAAGAGVANEGGSSFVVVDFNNLQGSVTSGFATMGIPAPDFPTLPAELPPEEDTLAADDSALTPATVTLIFPDGSSVEEGHLPNGSNPDVPALTQSGVFTVIAAEGLASLTIDGRSVIAGGVFTPTFFTTALGNSLEVTAYDPVSGQVSYRFTLASNQTHPSLQGQNPLAESFNVVATDRNGGSASGALEVTILDDLPLLVDQVATVPEGLGLEINFAFVLDFSTSIDDAELNEMIDAVKAAGQEVFARAGGDVHLSVIAFSSTALAYGPFDTLEAFQAQLNALNPMDGGSRPLERGTDFTDAIQATMNFYEPILGASNQVFFLSDGNPNEQLGSDGNSLVASTALTWRNFLDLYSIQVTAIGIGNNINTDRLQEVDLDGNGAPVLVKDFPVLIDTLIPLVQPASVHGNVLDDAMAGADGGRLVSIEVPATAGLTTYTWDGANTITLSGAQSGVLSGYSLTVTTAIGGTFTFYFEAFGSNPAGQWQYVAPFNVRATVNETFSYQYADSDGDMAEATLTIAVANGGAVSTNDLNMAREALAVPLVAPTTTASLASSAPFQTSTLQGNLLNESNTLGAIGVTYANALAVTLMGVDLTGGMGTLHVESSGAYAYTPYDGPLPSDATDRFQVTVLRADGADSILNVAFDYSGQRPTVHYEGTAMAAANESYLLQANDILVAEDTLLIAEGDFPLPNLSAGAGADTLIGSNNSEVLQGAAGDDILIGGSGNDILVGGEGNDIMTGGAGSDIFIWKAGEEGMDTITDFMAGIGGDVLHLADMLQDEHANADILGSYLSFTFDGKNTTLIVDVDGTGQQSPTQSILLQDVDLTANNTLSNAAIISNLLNDGNLRVDT